MSLMALDIGIDDEVIYTIYLYINSRAIALVQNQFLLILIQKPTILIIVLLKKSFKKKTIIPVSLYGQCPDFDEINQLAEKYKIPVIEDAAQSFGATYKGKRHVIINYRSTSFSKQTPWVAMEMEEPFTNDDHLAKILKEIRAHGQDRRYHHPRIVNGRLDTMQAVLLRSLKYLMKKLC